MSDGSIDLGEPTRLLRLDTLVRLRWLSVVGQVTAIVVVSWVLWYPMPSFAALGVVGLSALLNLSIRAWPPASQRLSDRDAFLMLAWDVLQLAALLYLTGGLQNPFSILFMAPVLISATALPPVLTLALGGLAAACATVLTVAHAPLPWRAGEPLELPLLYISGVWAAVLLGLGFTGVYAWRVAQEARDLSQALTATELVLAREQHLTQLDGLAAAAAHELGTPLATIALVAEELSRATPKDAPTAEDVALLRSEVDRCRHILGKLTTLQDEDEGPLGVLSLGHLLEEVAHPHRAFETKVKVRLGGKGPEPALRRNPGLLYGLGNLLENAVDFAQDEVVIDAAWDDDTVRVRVRDDGPGFPPEILARVGEPYVTTRGLRGRAKGESAHGLGLGLFIAKTLIERSGARLVAANAPAPDRGAVVTATWPRAGFDVRRGEAGGVGRFVAGGTFAAGRSL